MTEPQPVGTIHLIGKGSRAVFLACRCGLLQGMQVDDAAGVVRMDCVCGIVATMPVGERKTSPPSAGS